MVHFFEKEPFLGIYSVALKHCNCLILCIIVLNQAKTPFYFLFLA